MIHVHETFICKPGYASKFAKLCKKAMEGNKELVQIMTDVTGQFNRVVIVTEYDNLTAYEKSWEDYKKDEATMKKMEEEMRGYQDMYIKGSREIYQLW